MKTTETNMKTNGFRMQNSLKTNVAVSERMTPWRALPVLTLISGVPVGKVWSRNPD
jgi:hypothetical protein